MYLTFERKREDCLKLRTFCRLALYLGGIVTIIQPLHVNGQNALPSHQPQTVESAWNHRKEVIKSLVLKATILEITKGRDGQPAKETGPLADNPPKFDRQSEAKIEFYYDGGKAASTRIWKVPIKDDSDKLVEQTFRATFDGQLNASLLEQTTKLSGSIEKKRSASGYITQNGDLLAVNLWIQPLLTLDAIRWNVSGMKMENEAIKVDGIECRRIRIPRKNSQWTSFVDADAARGWIPMQWQTWLGGRLTMKLSIQYKTDEKVGPLVSGWIYASYNNVGESKLVQRGLVTHCEANVKIDPSHFTIKFPVGTPIFEDIDGGRRYYMQKVEGMVPVNDSIKKRKSANLQDGAENRLQQN
jgi:hypothetical protein